MTKEFTCTVCPRGCHLSVDIEKKIVSGNSCKRGEAYGISEVFNPVRTVTTVVKIKNSNIKMLPVKTSEPIKKDLNFQCISEINKITVESPIKVGDIIIKNILNTGADIIATKNADKIK